MPERPQPTQPTLASVAAAFGLDGQPPYVSQLAAQREAASQAKPYRLLRAQMSPEAQATAEAKARVILAWRFACDRCARPVPDLRRCQVCGLDVCALCLGLRAWDDSSRPVCTVHTTVHTTPDNCA